MKKKFFIYFIGNFGSKFLNLLMIPLFTMYINASEFGEFDYWMTISNLLIIFLGLNLQDAAYMNVLKDKNETSIIINKLVKTVVIQSVVIVITYLIIFTIMGFNLFIMLLFILIVFNNLHSFFSQGIARGLEKNNYMAMSSIILSLIIALSTVLFVVLIENNIIEMNYAYLLIIAQILGYIFSVLYLLFALRKNLNLNKIIEENLNVQEVITWIKFSFPLVINSLAWWIIYLSGRIITVKYLGNEENGVFSIANRFPSLMFMLNTIFTLVWQDYAILVRNNKDNNLQYSMYLKRFTHIQFICLIIFTIVFYYASPFILKNEYLEGRIYVPLLMYATIFSGFASFYSAFYFSTGKSNGAILSSVVSSIIFVSISLIFIDSLKLYALAIAMIASYMTMLILRSFEFRNKLKILFPWKMVGVYTLIFLLIYSFVYEVI